jgi:putative acetyltransferase
MTITFRPNEPSDAEALLQIWRRAVDSTHEFLTAEDRVAIDPLVADYVSTAPLVVASMDDVAVAFMGVTGQNIDSLFIDPKGHGFGIGRSLVEQVPRPTTVDVNEQNEGGVAFYRRLGFQVTGQSETDGEGRPYPLLHMRRD